MFDRQCVVRLQLRKGRGVDLSLLQDGKLIKCLPQHITGRSGKSVKVGNNWKQVAALLQLQRQDILAMKRLPCSNSTGRSGLPLL